MKTKLKTMFAGHRHAMAPCLATAIFALLLSVPAPGVAQEQAVGADANAGQQRHGQQRNSGGRGGQSFMQPQRMLQRMTRHLNLDDVQVEQVSNILESARPELEQLREQGQAQRVAERELDVSDADYGVKLQNLASAKGEFAAASTELRGRVRAEVFAVLTPDQQQAWQSMAERQVDGGRHERRRGQRGRNQ